MSASREKKARQELAGAAGYVDPKVKKAQEERAKQRRGNTVFAVCAVAFVLAAIALFVWNSKVIQQNAKAVEVDGTAYSVSEFSYFYYTAYLSYLNSDAYGSQADTSRSLREQTSPYGDGTLYDHIVSLAAKDLASYTRIAAAAKADGFDGGTELSEQVNSTIELYKSSAQSSGYTYEQFLRSNFGSLVTPKAFEKCLKLVTLASLYGTKYTDELTITDADLQAAYEAESELGDYVSFEYAVFDADAASDASDEDKEKAAALASANAQMALGRVENGESLETVADELEASYGKVEYGYYSYSEIYMWLFDADRVTGDSTVIADSSGTRFYALLFNGRTRADFHPVNVRHILVSDEQTAADVWSQWNAGEATEASFAALANEKSSDTGSNTTGGLYENIYLGQMVKAFEDWCFDPARQSGDTDIVPTDYGYHVMYFVSRSDLSYWETVFSNTLKSDAANAWVEEIGAGADPVLLGGMRYIDPA